MKATAAPRWAVSFADLGLLLIGCFVMLNAMHGARSGPARGGAAAVPSMPADESWPAGDLFDSGEARLRPDARMNLRAAGRRWAGRPIRILSRGAAEGGARLDRFELAAARSAAVARALHEGGVGERDIEVRLEEAGDDAYGQIIAIAGR